MHNHILTWSSSRTRGSDTEKRWTLMTSDLNIRSASYHLSKSRKFVIASAPSMSLLMVPAQNWPLTYGQKSSPFAWSQASNAFSGWPGWRSSWKTASFEFVNLKENVLLVSWVYCNCKKVHSCFQNNKHTYTFMLYARIKGVGYINIWKCMHTFCGPAQNQHTK